MMSSCPVPLHRPDVVKTMEHEYFKDRTNLRFSLDAVREWKSSDGLLYWFLRR